MNGAVYMIQCPLAALEACRWESAPATSEAAAREAVRGHLNEHHHSDLVTFAAAHIDEITRYERVPALRAESLERKIQAQEGEHA